MDPCPFARVLVGNLALRLPNKLSSTLSSSFSCDVKLVPKSASFPTQTSPIPIIISEGSVAPEASSHKSLAACFELDKSQIDKFLLEKRPNKSNNPCIEISIYRGRGAGGAGGMCGLGGSKGKFLGKVVVPVPAPMPELMEFLRKGEPRGVMIHNGWVKVGAGGDDKSEEVFVTVRVESDPRFMFEFEKEPECSPQVFQVQGNVKQPVFTCKFSCRNAATDRNLRSISSSLSEPGTSRSWLSSITSGDKDQQGKERKGWSITIHDLSGSPVAAASMVTPFVPSPGTDHVSRSNPGAWLILRPGQNTWKPWGRLEAWRERAGSDALSHRFELLSDIAASPSTATPVASGSTMSIGSGGKFVIDTTANLSPMPSPSSSMDLGSGNWSGSGSTDLGSPWPNSFLPGGFVMSSTMQGVDKSSRPEVEVGVHHVACTEDAAVFVALAAAMDLSMDACRLFSQKLRKELRHTSQEFVL